MYVVVVYSDSHPGRQETVGSRHTRSACTPKREKQSKKNCVEASVCLLLWFFFAVCCLDLLSIHTFPLSLFQLNRASSRASSLCPADEAVDGAVDRDLRHVPAIAYGGDIYKSVRSRGTDKRMRSKPQSTHTHAPLVPRQLHEQAAEGDHDGHLGLPRAAPAARRHGLDLEHLPVRHVVVLVQQRRLSEEARARVVLGTRETSRV